MPHASQEILLIGGIFSAIAAMAHLACIAVGAPAYRFMGAGERMAHAAEAQKIQPTLITFAISLVLLLWALYAFSGAGVIRQLPLTNIALPIISLAYLARAFSFPVLKPIFPENSTKFWLISSSICLVIGVFYAIGASAILFRQ